MSRTIDNARRLFDEGDISMDEYEEIVSNHIDAEIDAAQDDS